MPALDFRAVATKRSQLGFETVPGTSVAATKWFRHFSFNINPRFETVVDEPDGMMLATGAAPEQDYVTGRYRGSGSYTELIDIFALAFGAPTIITPAGGTLTRYHEYYLDTFGPTDPKTATIEEGNTGGSGGRVHKASNVFATDMNIRINRQRFEVTGNLMGQQLQDNVAMTGSPTARPYAPARGTQTRVFAMPATTLSYPSSWLTSQKVVGLFGCEFRVNNRQGAVWTVDADFPSWENRVQTKPVLEFEMTVNAGSAGMAYLTNLRQGDMMYFRIEVKGPLIETTFNYGINIDFNAQLVSPNDFRTEQNSVAIPWRFRVMHNDVWTRGILLRLINKETTF